MGITIQYKGQLTDTSRIYELIEEVAEISNTMDWDFDVLDQEWRRIPTAHFESSDEGGIRIVGNTCLKGIQFIPHPKCEPIWLFFTSLGYLSTPFHIALDAEDLYPERKVWITSITHYAGADTHISIINLFRHLKNKYLHDLEIHDEGGYWSSGNKNLLESRIKHLNEIMALTDEELMKLVQERDRKNKEE